MEIKFNCGATVNAPPLLVEDVHTEHDRYCHHCPPDTFSLRRDSVWESRVASALTRWESL
ncbi:hypothetical protein DFO66_103318 [Brevibacterium sanguinis]|uniref:Uncharacterized protein n=2 Tax=Brevibacterium TaxID=1696 RepID=A0A366IKS9_9MICO|nr:hypothetical protein DFO66_103318 [Brevibacterium sanguinis]RBP73022.1 hypothetical protein DFO65_103317 [Brevibacterium celere]